MVPDDPPPSETDAAPLIDAAPLTDAAPPTDAAGHDDASARDDAPAPGLGFKVHDRRHWSTDAETDEPGRAQVPSFVEHLQQQLEKKDKQLQEYIAAYKTEVAGGLEETKQRLSRDAEQRAKLMRADMAQPMLDVLDTFERSLQLAHTATDVATLAEGMRMVHLLIVQKLKEMGLERIDAVGRPFDPAIHEALAVVDASDAAPRDTVVDELSPGFMLEGRVVRPARVRVAK